MSIESRPEKLNLLKDESTLTKVGRLTGMTEDQLEKMTFLDVLRITNALTNKEILKGYNDRGKLERGQRVLCYMDSESPPKYLTYGIFQPSYSRSLLELSSAENGPERHKSLLIGALTRDTIQEYQATVWDIFPQAETYTVDIEGEETKQEYGFVFGDGLRLPFADGSIDTVHTNVLLYQLNYQAPSHRDVLDLMSEANRVIRPGGKLIMVETNLEVLFPGTSKGEQAQILVDCAYSSGFSDVMATQASSFRDRQSMYKVLSGSEQSSADFVIPNPYAILLTASKD